LANPILLLNLGADAVFYWQHAATLLSLFLVAEPDSAPESSCGRFPLASFRHVQRPSENIGTPLKLSFFFRLIGFLVVAEPYPAFL